MLLTAMELSSIRTFLLLTHWLFVRMPLPVLILRVIMATPLLRLALRKDVGKRARRSWYGARLQSTSLLTFKTTPLPGAGAGSRWREGQHNLKALLRRPS